MTDKPVSPEEILNGILAELGSDDSSRRLAAIQELHSFNYSSEAIRLKLEQLALKDSDDTVARAAAAALDLPTHRHVINQLTKLNRGDRQFFLQEIEKLEAQGLLDPAQADVIKKRYNFDMAPPPAPPQPVPGRAAAPAPQPLPPPAPPQPPGPQPTLLQTLLSETSIKIALYLGAFFVIAAAAILGAAIPELRLPILIIGTFVFGGLAVAIKKRLPQPSFALFIIFSFLLPITANTIEETLRSMFDLSASFSAGYWVFIYLIMAAIWSGSTRLYESRLFSVTAFGSLALAMFRIGDIFEAQPEFYAAVEGVAALSGLAGTWLMKKWKGSNFALPLFLATQLLQVIILVSSISIFGAKLFDPSDPALWHLVSLITWGLASLFYASSNLLFPFALVPWLAAGTLIPLPWFIDAAFDLESLGSAIIFFAWGAMLSTASEILHRIEPGRKYSLPVLLAAIPSFTFSIITSFDYDTWLGLLSALGIALVFTVLHTLRTRWWLWTMALFNFTIAYFAFFNLGFMQKTDVFVGYQVLGISILFLLPDILLKKDLKADPAWRLPLRLYGALFTFYSFIILPFQNEPGNAAVCFAVYAVFFGVYALAYRNALLGYLHAAFLPLSVFFTLDHFDVDTWLPALTALAVLYFLIGFAIRAKGAWSFTLRNSALALGAILSLAVLITLKETGGWYALVIGLLFFADMYLRRNGWFEAGAPISFSIGAFLILRELHIKDSAYLALAISLIWLGSDLLHFKMFKEPRPLKWIMRGVGAAIVVFDTMYLAQNMFLNDPRPAVVCFGIYTLFFLTYSLFYRQPVLGYAFTASLPLFVLSLLQDLDQSKWLLPIIAIAVLYYIGGYLFRRAGKGKGWESTLLFSGLGLGTINAFSAPFQGGLDASIPVAAAATLWAIEAFARRNVWLGFPTNALYLMAYFMILIELKVDEPQFFSMGAALLGMIMHYLLTRAGSKTGAFITGMVSQLVLLGTSYIQMLDTGRLLFFVVLFFQSLAVMVYGIVIRSRSLVFAPIFFSVVGVVTVVYSALKGLSTIILIGCTGIILLMLGILAVLMRERITKLGERLSDWQA